MDEASAEEVGKVSEEVLKLIDKIVTMVTKMPLT